MVKILLLCLILTVTSCGTITKRDEFIQIDSSPRGIIVQNSNKEILGITPLTVLSLGIKYNYFFTESGMREHRLKCSIDWKESVVPNLILAPFSIPTGLIFSGIFILTDYAFNNLHTCNKVLNITTIETQKDKQKIKNKVIILPVFEGNFLNIDNIAKVYKEHRNLDFNFLNYTKVLESFSKFGVNEERRWNVSSIKKRALLRVVNEFDAPYALEIKREVNDTVRIKLIDLYTYKQIDTDVLIKVQVNEGPESINQLTKKYLHFFPNGLTFGTVKSQFSYEDNDNANDLKFQRHPDDFHWFIGAWALTHVSSPHLFETWDYEFKFSPHASMPSLKASNRSGYSILLQTYNLSFDFVSTGHTAIGAFSFQVGPGIGYIKSSDSLNSNTKGFTPIFHMGVSHSAFITERFFTKFGVDIYGSLTKKISSQDEKINSFSNISFNIGYFLPEFRSFFR